MKTHPINPAPTVPARGRSPRSIPKPRSQSAEWNLQLYVAGETPRSCAAFSHLKKICDEYLGGRYRIEVIDLLKVPERAARDQIVAVPTLVRQRPASLKRIVGDLSNLDRVLVDLGLHPDENVHLQLRN